MLFHKMLRDMKLHKTQFISIFIMSILGVFIFVGISSEWYGLQTTVNKYYKDTNMPNVWVYGKGFTKEDSDKVAGVKGVTGVERRFTLSSIADFNNKPELKLYFVEKNEISKCKLVKGIEFSLDKDGVWLDSQFAEAKNLKVGDSISVTANGIKMKKEILGTVLNPEYIYSKGNNDIVPNHENYGFAYLSYKAFPKDMQISYSDILITTDNENYTQMEDKINAALDGHYSVFLTRDNNESYATFNGEIEQHKAMGLVFPLAFVAIAMLTIITTMTRIINNQRTQIGTLKALGFKRRRILFHYVSYGLWISISGSFIGAILGPFTIPYLFYDALKTTYTMPEWKPAISLESFTMAFISILFCTLATYLACRNALKDTPAQTLRPKAPKHIKQGFFEKTRVWSKLGYSLQWNLRDMFRSKVRSIMAVIGVLGCTALLVCAFGMQDSLDDVITWQYSEINTFQTKCILSSNISNAKYESLKKNINGEALMEGAVEIKVNGIKKSGELLVTDNVTLIHSQNYKREQLILPEDSLSISYKMANLLGVEEGDKVSWHVYGDERWVTSTVDAIYRTPISQGITVMKGTFEKLGYQFKPTALITKQNLSGKIDGVESIWSKSDLTKSYETMTEAMSIMVYVLILAASILAVVVLYCLGVLSFTERQRELATLKVIGFKTKKIRRLLLTQTIWLTFIGIIIGVPSGKWLIYYMISFMGDSFDMMTIVSVPSIIYSISITLLLSVVVNLMFSGKIKSIDMVSSLKGVE